MSNSITMFAKSGFTATLLLLAGAGFAQASKQPAPIQSEASIVASKQFDLTSSINGRSYRIQITIPPAPPPPNGYPVIYALDGNGIFGTFSDASRGLLLGNEIGPVVIVGIGYPISDYTDQFRLRFFDLTPIAGGGIPNSPDLQLDQGGTDLFLRAIDEEIRPAVGKLVALDPDQQTLFGHSLGGLTALRALYTRPESFDRYVISSPSIWWHDRFVLTDQHALQESVKAARDLPQVFLLVGGDEQSLEKQTIPAGMTREQWAETNAYVRAVDNTREAFSALSSLYGTQAERVRYKVYDNQSHFSVVWASVNDILAFAAPKSASD